MEYNIDAEGKTLGRLASEVALLLQGKQHARYKQNRVSGDRVVVVNVHRISVSGKKAKNKIYYQHTGYMGHLKAKRYEDEARKDPRRILREAVRRMLPKNFLNQRRLNNLVFKDTQKSTA